MKYSFLIVVIFIGIISNTFSQEKKLEKLVSLGISRPILSNGTGFHAGFNPSFKLTKSSIYSFFLVAVIFLLYPWPTSPWSNFYSFMFFL